MIKILSKILVCDFRHFKGDKIVHCLKVFFLGILIHIGFTIIKVVTEKIGIFNSSPHPNAKGIASESNIETLFVIFVVTVLATPIIEELSFRLSNSRNREKVLAGFSFMLTFLVLIFTDVHHIIPIHKELAFTASFLIVGGLTYLVLSQIFPNFALNNRGLTMVLLITNISFAIAHLNISLEQPTYLGYLILLFPYVVSGYLYSYAALTMGLGYAILCHALKNGFFFLLNVL